MATVNWQIAEHKICVYISGISAWHSSRAASLSLVVVEKVFFHTKHWLRVPFNSNLFVLLNGMSQLRCRDWHTDKFGIQVKRSKPLCTVSCRQSSNDALLHEITITATTRKCESFAVRHYIYMHRPWKINNT